MRERRKHPNTGVSPVERIIAQEVGDEKVMTVSQAAIALGISQTTLRRIYRSGKHPKTGPSKELARGNLRVYLYTEENIEELKKILKGNS